jgi:tellurite resistance protein TehA-like permease
MAKEKIEDVSTEKLLKRKKFFFITTGICIGIILVFIALIVYDLINDGKVEKTSFYGLIPIVGIIWLPVFAIRAINAELERREDY